MTWIATQQRGLGTLAQLEICFAVMAPMATAQASISYACLMNHGNKPLRVDFSYDSAQFAPPVSTDDPPRRAVAQVDLGGRQMVAEAVILPGGWAGFHSDAPPDVEILMIVDPDGAASLSIAENKWRGTCEVAK